MGFLRKGRKDTHKPQQHIKRFFGLDEIDRKLREHIDRRCGFFVELGANDGLTQSNTMHFEQELDWTGILVEPIPHQFLACRKNRTSRNSFFCAACVPFDYEQRFVPMLYANLMSTSLDEGADLAVSAHEHARLGKMFLEEHENNFIFGALARTLTSILEEAGAPKQMNLLSLDVEGHELDVLRGFRFDIYRFDHIVIESRDFEKTESFLNLHGYDLLEKLTECDLLFKLTKS